MLIDHIFIFVPSRQAADQLVDFGLSEGSGNIHKGIGTANRRFFFDNFYLEILWVEDETEAKSVAEIGIWERSDYINTGYSRFGLCLENTEATDPIFCNSIKWKPLFLPQGECVNILTSAVLPWIFRFPQNRQKSLTTEPRTHKSGIKQLSQATFHISENQFESKLNYISASSIVSFIQDSKNSLELEFDNNKQGKIRNFEQLNLSIRY